MADRPNTTVKVTDHTPENRYTVLIGRTTLERLAKRQPVTLVMSDGTLITLLDADDFPREATECIHEGALDKAGLHEWCKLCGTMLATQLATQTADPSEARLQQLDRAIADAKDHYLELIAERYDLMTIKYAPHNPAGTVKGGDAI